MFNLFRLKKKAVAGGPALQDKMAGKLVETVLRVQRRWAVFMDQKVNGLPVRLIKTGLVFFTGLSVLVWVRIVIATFQRPEVVADQSIAVPQQRSSAAEARGSPLIPQQQYKRVAAFHHYMDSLAASVTGRRVFDSINRYRPGLLDSVLSLEKLYQQQNKSQ